MLSFLRVPVCCVVISILTSAIAASTENSKPGTAGTKPDLFVTAAPIVVGAVCRDGVAIVAAHTSHVQEPLLYTIYNEEQSSDYFLDLPENYAGPFRIRSVDAYGTTFVACGWRADGDFLFEKAKSVASAEVLQHGPPSMTHYRKFLSSQLSLHMAQCALSDKMRPLSSVCLLAYPVTDPNLPSLWLVDPTGAYPVRAICLGGGMDSASGEPLAKIVQLRLRKNDIDFTSMTTEEGVNQVLKLLEGDDSKGRLLQKGTRLEVAIVKERGSSNARRTIESLLLDRQ